MQQQEAFLQAVRENPADDVCRLVFADWLEENGQAERAEFIRVQIELARLEAAQRRDREREARSRKLLRAYGKKWFPIPRGWGLVSTLEIRRGFPECLMQTPRAVLEHAERLLGLWPITRIRPLGATPANLASQLAAMPFLSQIRRLDLYYLRLGPDGVVAWLSGFPNLLTLHAGCNNLGDAGLAHLLSSPQLAGVRELDVRHNGITSAGVRSLTHSPYTRGLRWLSLCGNPSIMPGVLDLLTSDSLTELEELSLWNTQLGDEGLLQLAGCPGLARLRTLDLTNNEISDRGLAALAASPHARNLRKLLLAINELSPGCVEVLAGSPYLQELNYLNVHLNKGLRGQSQRLHRYFGERVTFKQPW